MLRFFSTSIVLALFWMMTCTAFAEPVKYKPFSVSTLPTQVMSQIKGEIKAGMHWKDRLGENFVVFSSIASENNAVYLQVKHFSIRNGQTQLIRFIKELEECPEFDNVTRFIPSSMGLTDIDKDGFAEISFLYFADCVSDMSPYATKLMLLENGKKFPIRGTAKYIIGGHTMKSEYTLGKEFKTAPASFKRFALQLWSEEALIDVDAQLQK